MRLFHDGDETCNLGRTLITAVVLFFHSDRKSIAAHFGVRIASCAVFGTSVSIYSWRIVVEKYHNG